MLICYNDTEQVVVCFSNNKYKEEKRKENSKYRTIKEDNIIRYNTFSCTEDQNALITLDPEGKIEEIEFIYRTPQSGTYKHQFYRRSGKNQPKLTEHRDKVKFAFYLLGKRNPDVFKKLCTTFADKEFRKELRETLQKIKAEYDFDFPE